jgi:hypothetical protein
MSKQQYRRLRRSVSAGAIGTLGIVGVGTAVEPACRTQLCHQAIALVTENRPTFPTDHPADVHIYPAGPITSASAIAIVDSPRW